MKYRILVVEDQEDISSIVLKYIEKEGYDSELAVDGFEVLKEIREISDVPVIMLTAKQQEVDRIRGFDFGADDYVIKPFSPRELMGRIKVIFRRVYNDSDEIILLVDQLRLYTKSMRLTKNEIDIEITSTEFQLLNTFMKNKGQVLSREQLITLSLGNDYEGFDRNIDSYIKRIRQKIEDDPKNPQLLKTKYGSGYVFGGDPYDN